MAILGWANVAICCSDLEVSTRFYEEVLGFRELFTVEMTPTVDSTDDYTARMFARDQMCLELVQWRTPEASGTRGHTPMQRFGLTHLVFRVDRWDELFEAARACGGTPLPETYENPTGSKVEIGILLDPDGVKIECISGVDDFTQLMSMSSEELAAHQSSMAERIRAQRTT